MEYGFASKKHREFPQMVVVSIVNICNLRCVHCHYSVYSKRSDFHPNMMEWGIWTKICDEMSLYSWSILNLGTDGEPLIHKRFLDMMRYARKKNIYPINMTTNGLLLHSEMVNVIIKENLLDVVNVSLDALSDEKYKMIRGHDKTQVYKNVSDFLELRNKVKSPIKIQANIIDQREVEDEVAAFVDYWTPKVDNVMVRTYYDSTHVTGAPGPNLTGKQKEFEHVERWPCQQFWRRINVSDNGVVRFCVDDWYNQSRLGDLHKSTLKQIWQGKTYDELRSLHLSGAFNKIPYCAGCTEWQGMKWDYDYFTAMEKMLGKKLV